MKAQKNKPPQPVRFPENLILIGMVGSGKSTIGRILADKLRYHFIDVDHLIEAKHRMPLQKVLDKLGMKKFMDTEDKTLQALRYRHCVISPGKRGLLPQGHEAFGKPGSEDFPQGAADGPEETSPRLVQPGSGLPGRHYPCRPLPGTGTTF